MEPRRLEQQPPLQLVPDVVVDAIMRQPIATEYPIVHSDDVGEIRRLCVLPEKLAGVGLAELSIDHRHYFEEWPNDFDMIDFQYNRNETPVATMQFLMMPDGSYGLHHRYVEPDFRKRGVGERLLAQAEQAFQQAANREQKDIEIGAQFGQRGVLQWFLNRGYELKDDHSRADWEEIKQHPERFVFETITDAQDGVVKEDCIFRLDVSGRTIQDTVRINLHKTITPT